MRSFSALLLLVFLTSACSENGSPLESTTGFTKIPSGVTTELFDIEFSSAGNGIIVGAAGVILRTSDGGDTWQKQASGTTEDLRAIKMNDPTTGLACGKSTLLKTSDGGATWATLAFPEADVTLMDLLFVDASTILVATSRGKIYKTTNGGTSWNVVQSNPSDFFTGFHLVGEARLKIFAYGGGGSASASTTALYSSSNSGSAWTKESVEFGQTITSMDFSTETAGFFSSYDNIVYKTSDLGVTWSRTSTPTNTTWREVKFISATEGYMSGEKGKVIQTKNGGSSWTELSTNETGSLYSMEFLGSKSTLYIVGENGAILARKN